MYVRSYNKDPPVSQSAWPAELHESVSKEEEKKDVKASPNA